MNDCNTEMLISEASLRRHLLPYYNDSLQADRHDGGEVQVLGSGSFIIGGIRGTACYESLSVSSRDGSPDHGA